MGNFRCVYPCLCSEKYEHFFYQNQSSLFQDTAASRAREECARMQREELEVLFNILYPFYKTDFTVELHTYLYLFTFCIMCEKDKIYKFSSPVYVGRNGCMIWGIGLDHLVPEIVDLNPA